MSFAKALHVLLDAVLFVLVAEEHGSARATNRLFLQRRLRALIGTLSRRSKVFFFVLEESVVHRSNMGLTLRLRDPLVYTLSRLVGEALHFGFSQAVLTLACLDLFSVQLRRHLPEDERVVHLNYLYICIEIIPSIIHDLFML